MLEVSGDMLMVSGNLFYNPGSYDIMSSYMIIDIIEGLLVTIYGNVFISENLSNVVVLPLGCTIKCTIKIIEETQLWKIRKKEHIIRMVVY